MAKNKKANDALAARVAGYLTPDTTETQIAVAEQQRATWLERLAAANTDKKVAERLGEADAIKQNRKRLEQAVKALDALDEWLKTLRDANPEGDDDKEDDDAPSVTRTPTEYSGDAQRAQ